MTTYKDLKPVTSRHVTAKNCEPPIRLKMGYIGLFAMQAYYIKAKYG